MRNLYLRDRDDQGRLKFDRPKRNPPPTYRDVFYLKWRDTGLREDLIDKLWAEVHGG